MLSLNQYFFTAFPGRDLAPSAISSGDLREELGPKKASLPRFKKQHRGSFIVFNLFTPEESSLRVIHHPQHRGILPVRHRSDWLRKGPGKGRVAAHNGSGSL